MLKIHDLNVAYGGLWFGRDCCTHIYAGGDLYGFLANRCEPRNAQGHVMFNGAQVIYTEGVPPWSAHFVNENMPHDGRYNGYYDWTDEAEDGLEPAPAKPIWVAPDPETIPIFHSTGYADNGIPVDCGSQDEWNLLWNSTEPIKRGTYKDDNSAMVKAGWALQLDFRNGHIVAIDCPESPIPVQSWCEQNLQKEA